MQHIFHGNSSTKSIRLRPSIFRNMYSDEGFMPQRILIPSYCSRSSRKTFSLSLVMRGNTKAHAVSE